MTDVVQLKTSSYEAVAARNKPKISRARKQIQNIERMREENGDNAWIDIQIQTWQDEIQAFSHEITNSKTPNDQQAVWENNIKVITERKQEIKVQVAELQEEYRTLKGKEAGARLQLQQVMALVD